jgi:hypothetical protein
LKRNHHASLALLQAVQNGTFADLLTLVLGPLGVDVPEGPERHLAGLPPGARRDDRRGRPKGTIANVDLFVKQYIHDLLPVQPVLPRF